MAEKLKHAQVSTDKQHAKKDTPRLPHEHDESFDSQSSEPRADMEQARQDIEQGLVDTDRRGTPGFEKPGRRTEAPLPPSAGEVARRSEEK